MNTDLDQEIKKYNHNKVICIIIGVLIAVTCLALIIYLNILINNIAFEATYDYANDKIILEEYEQAMNKVMILSIVQGACGLGITGGAALAIAGGIVNHVKAKNRVRKQHRRNIAEEYGGNGVEF